MWNGLIRVVWGNVLKGEEGETGKVGEGICGGCKGRRSLSDMENADRMGQVVVEGME